VKKGRGKDRRRLAALTAAWIERRLVEKKLFPKSHTWWEPGQRAWVGMGVKSVANARRTFLSSMIERESEAKSQGVKWGKGGESRWGNGGGRWRSCRKR